MRVPNLSMYGNSTYRLGGITSNLQDANEVIATQKRINSLSDDPIGFSQVLGLKSSIGNLEQIEKNVSMGLSWLSGAESSLDSVNNLILDAKSQVSRLVNASMSSDERKNAIGSINSMIEQIVTFGNTRINGNYIFGGTDTDTPPLAYHADEDPPTVSYAGNHIPFSIKTDKNVTVPVGRDGKETFWEDKIKINSTNNTIIFKEDNGHGSASQIIMEATIDDGTYTTAQIETAVKNALNDVSSRDGYSVTYEVEYDEEQKAFSIREDGSYDGFVRTEFMWETGADAYISKISGSDSIDPDDINVTVVNSDALTFSTPEPHGTEPFRLTWQGDDTWEFDNNPGYTIIPATLSGTNDSVGIDLNESGFADITITLDNPVTATGQFIEFDIVSARGDHSIGHEIGFNKDNSIYAPPTSDTTAVFATNLIISIGINDTIEFEEIDSAGAKTVPPLSITIPNDNYTDMDSLAAVIESAIKMESQASGNNINYAVSYDAREGKFTIQEDGSSQNEFQILWSSSSAASVLGFYGDDKVGLSESDEPVVNITINSTNNKIDFREILKVKDGKAVDELTADIKQKTYTSHSELALEVEKALEEESYQNGNHIDYSVSWDSYTKNFTIKENGTELAGFDLLWQTGENAPVSAGGSGGSIGEILGFDIEDDIAAPIESDREVEWGIFNTLIDLNQYLEDNDLYGIERTLGRLDAHFDSMTSKIVDVGNKYNRLEIRDKITTENSLTLTQRKSTIEDADIVEAIMNLQAIETAYQASLSSTAKIMNLSLVDYL